MVIGGLSLWIFFNTVHFSWWYTVQSTKKHADAYPLLISQSIKDMEWKGT